MKSGEWGIIILVVIIISIMSSLIVTKITGNVIGVQSGISYKVYTAEEIDNKIGESYLLDIASIVKYPNGIKTASIRNALTEGVMPICNNLTLNEKCIIGNITLVIFGINYDKKSVSLSTFDGSKYSATLDKVYNKFDGANTFVMGIDNYFVAKVKK